MLLPPKIDQNLSLVEENDDFIESIRKFRVSWKIPRNGFSKDQQVKNWQKNQIIEADNNLISINKFYNELNLLRIKYKLSENYNHPLKLFALCNKWSLPSATGNMLIKTEKNKYGETNLFIQIFPETTIEDIRKEWNNVKLYQKKLTGYRGGRFKKRNKLARDKRIFQLRKEGKKGKEIQSIINEEFEEGVIAYDYVSKVIKRLKKDT